MARFCSGGKSQSLVKPTTSDSAWTGANACSSEPAGARGVELVDRAGDVEVGVGVEAVDEALALVAQVALDLELRVEGVGLAAGGLALLPCRTFGPSRRRRGR